MNSSLWREPQLLNGGVNDVASDTVWSVTQNNMIATCGGIGSAEVVRILDFPAGIVGVNGVMKFVVLEELVSTDGKQQFIPPLTPVTLVRQLGANNRDVLEIEDDRGKIPTEKLIRERSGHAHNQLDFFSKGGWSLPTDLRAQLKYDPFIADILFKCDTCGKYIPTSECYGFEVLENTSALRANRDDVLPEDLWPNFNAMVTKLQERYIGSHEETLVAQQHGFDRDFWAGSSNAPMMVLYRVHVKQRSTMFDPDQCATSTIPAGVQILSRKTFLSDTRVRRTAEIEHDFNRDKDAWSASIEGVKWTGVYVFRMAAAVDRPLRLIPFFDEIDFTLLWSKAQFEQLNMECSKFHGSRDERNVHDVVLVGGSARIKFLATKALHRVGGLVFDTHGNRFANELEGEGLRDRRDVEE